MTLHVLLQHMQLFHSPSSSVPQQGQTSLQSILPYPTETSYALHSYAGAAEMPSAGLSVRFVTQGAVDMRVRK